MSNQGDSEHTYQLTIFQGTTPLDPLDNNVDIQVKFASGERYVATFYTLKNIQNLMEKFKKSGECKDGLYFWGTDMIIVQTLTEEVIRKTIDDLILKEEFKKAFSGPFID